MTTYTQTFGGQTVQPSQLSYRALALTANTQLVWPLDAAAGASVVANIMDVSPTASGYLVIMPDARLVSTGEQVLFYNPTAYTFSVVRNSYGFEPPIANVAAGKAVLIYLRTNDSIQGGWRSVAYGVGTSAPDAASLSGLGVLAISTTLNWNSDTQTKNANYTLLANDRATTTINTGGAITFAFTAASTLGDGWVILIRNEGSGSLTLNPNGAETIDGAATKVLAATESCIVVCDGTAFHTVGYGRSATVTTTAVNINLAGTGTYTESVSEVASQIQNYTGLLTGARIVEFGTAAGYWFVFNNTTGAFTVTCRVNNLDAGAVITQGNYSIIRSDGTNLTVAFSATVGTVTNVATGTGLTGGPITTTGTIALANTAATPGTFGSATKAVIVTVDAQGRLTASSEATITPAFASLTGTPTTLAGYGITDGALNTVTLTAGTGLTGGGDLTTNRTFAIANTAVTPASYTNVSATVDQQGRITAMSSGTAPVTTVSGTAPIASSGGTTPAISLNDTAVTPGTYTRATLTVDQKGRLTAASSSTQPSIVAQCAFNGTGTPAFLGTPFNCTSITDNGTGNWTINFTSTIASTNAIVELTCKRTSGNSVSMIDWVTFTTSALAINVSALNSGSSTVFAADSEHVSMTIWI